MDVRNDAFVVKANSKARLFSIRYQGHVSAALVLGGVDCTGSYLHTVYPHGSHTPIPPYSR